MMNANDPLPLRCLALTGSFETGCDAPECFGSVAGDFDGQGLSFSVLQWNLGQRTLQPLLRKLYVQSPQVLAECFPGLDLGPVVNPGQAQNKAAQLAWSRSIQFQGDHSQMLHPEWAAGFHALGLTREWQEIAVDAAAAYFDHARFLASQYNLKSDRGTALMFDIAVQNGGIPASAARTIQALSPQPQTEPDRMVAIAHAVADCVKPQWRVDVLHRKLTIANGFGIVHETHYDLAAQFAL